MSMDEVIKGIEQASSEEIQDLLQSVIGRYRQRYPDWKILFISADRNATDDRSKELIALIDELEEKYTWNAYVILDEK